MLEKVNGTNKRKFTEVEQDSSTDDQDAKVRKTEGTPETGTDASASEDAPGDGWTCASCTFINHPALDVCEICENSRYAIEMLQMQLEDMKHKTNVVEPPSNWQPVDPGTRQRFVELAVDDKDYMDISKTLMTFGFHVSPGGSSSSSSSKKTRVSKYPPLYSIKKIERNENFHLYQMYMIKKEQMKEENGPTVENEKMLWHGTSPECVGSIASYGFNRSHCGKNGTAFGQGVYFSTGPMYSSNVRYATPDKSGLQYMFYSRVLTGTYTNGNSGMVEPPMYANKAGRFNSLTNHVQSPCMFVVFHDAQAYPEFLITFTSPH